jgi:hypothetical protein
MAQKADILLIARFAGKDYWKYGYSFITGSYDVSN